MKNRNQDILDQTIRLWRDRSEGSISREDAKEIINNINGFFQVLLSWDHEDREERGDGIEAKQTKKERDVQAMCDQIGRYKQTNSFKFPRHTGKSV